MRIYAICAAIFVLCTILLVATLGSNQTPIANTTKTFSWAILRLGNGELIEGSLDSYINRTNTIEVTINGITYQTHYTNVILATEKP